MKRARKKPAPKDRRRLALLIFAVALLSRLLFWQATPDRAWGWTAYYKGDAPLWLEYARAIDTGQPFELGLPIHPPGTAWLAALLWDGDPSGVGWLRFVWVVMGALVPLLVFLAAERSFGLRVAAIAGGFCAISTGLLILSTSIDSETPYLLLVLASLWLMPDLKEGRSFRRIAVWSVLNAVACLFRVDHLLFYLLTLAFFVVLWTRQQGARATLRLVAASLLFFILPLVPWHLSAWSAIRRFNEEPRRLNPTEERAVTAVEQALQHIPWTAEAARRRDELPGFLRRTASSFVLATVYFRGGKQVRAEDLGILEQAFGYMPRPLQRYPFVSLYGPLNFALANHPDATGGFDRAPLEAPPPLGGGPSSYPSFLVQGLPPQQLSFVYPPHLRLFNEGYAIGAEWVREHPRDFARLAWRKLSIFWSGAAHGVTGYGIPAGLSGVRRAVDLVTPDSRAAVVWGVVLLAAAIAGLAACWRHAAVWPWLFFLASRVAVTILFFGYARHGATVIPVLALLLALALDRLPHLPEPRFRTALAAALLLALATDLTRLIHRPLPHLDARPLRSTDPDPPDLHRDQRLEISPY